ncbi:hypothetical protein OAK15_05575, partial [Verrucomicrobia bacterium]|nr:hypothetical protein [Verrucomicrobiota bacterium]
MDVQSQFPNRDIEVYPLTVAPLGVPKDWFLSGNFCSAAGSSLVDGLHNSAAMGLIGRVQPAIAGLEKEDSDEARFYLGAALWIEGTELEAVDVLTHCNLPQAKRLLALIRKPQINILAQTVWEDEDFEDDHFRVQRIGAERTVSNEETIDNRKPYLSILEDLDYKPDFYFAHMIEWQYLPYDLHQLNCPTFGTTSDIDLHIQNNAPWVDAFDEVVTVGAEEWAKVRALRTGTTVTYPKLFGVNPKQWIDIDDQERDLDIIISGTMSSPYHPDKALLMQQLLTDGSLRILSVDGFLHHTEFFPELARSKVSFTYVRHPGSMPSRGLESL